MNKNKRKERYTEKDLLKMVDLDSRCSLAAIIISIAAILISIAGVILRRHGII